MNTDWYIDQGYSHKMCEDYAVVGEGFAIVSDGCSSSEYTDIGARILCMSAKEIITRFLAEQKGPTPLKPDFLKAYVIGRSESIIKNLGLPMACLNATLIIVYVHNNLIYTYMYGDGYIIVTYKDGKKKYIKSEFPENAPYYPSYSIDFASNILYKDQIGEHYYKIEKSVESDKWYSIKKPLVLPVVDCMTKNLVSNIVIATDGMGSFLDRSQGTAELISDMDIIEELTCFKLMKGEFIKRRAGKAMKKFKKNNIIHYDDLAIAGINIPEEEECSMEMK